MSKAEAKREVARLVNKLDSLTRREFKKYDEENTKKDFILPLFRALGWATEDRREVTAEDKVSRRRVDYAFRIEGIPKFFLEAKPLKADLDNPEYAWQAINYAWTKGVTWAVLTDFEGLKVFNAQWKGPNLLYNRFLDIPYVEYIEGFDELWLLSRESFDKALLDIEAEKVAKKGKREPVGKQLFDDLITWRQKLYRQLRGWKENKEYSEAEIDEAVQRILDRLIFIRTAEDRELEERVLLPAVREWRENGHRKELDKALVRIFRDFDVKYDSELFEAGHFCEKLACDSNTHASVIEGLYGMRDEVPTYNFDAIDVDVLGGIYEQYLSYRQGLPEEVEEAKRARRKKRGIYYTPKFVVQYIVGNTVGRLLQERSHDEIRKLRILDPACGSGSFLIEAFDRLDRYHQEARGTAQRSDEKAARDDFLERLRILRDNIYGVDLDPQAVEIARLNLLLKTLHRRALLPKLENNIRRGNSLISGLPIELSQYFGADWEAKRRFNWEEEFPKIMKEGGFDVVIGNPPYVRIQTLDRDEVAYYKEKYQAATGNYDIYTLFVERGWELLKPGGLFGMILPNKFMHLQYGKGLRKVLSEANAIVQLVDFGDAQVFGTGTTYTCLLFLRKKQNPHISYVLAADYLEQHPTNPNLAEVEPLAIEIPVSSINSSPWVMVPKHQRDLMQKFQTAGAPLEAIAPHIFQGLVTSEDSIYILEAEGRLDQEVTKVYSRATQRRYELESGVLKPLLSGKDINRYCHTATNRLLLFPYKESGGKGQLIPPEEFASMYPRCWNYLLENRDTLENREKGKMRHEGWYGYVYPKNLTLHDKPKMAIPRLVDKLKVTYDSEGHFYLDNVDVGGVILREPEHRNYLYVLGLLNTRLLDWYFKRISVPFRGGFYSANRQFISPLPIRRIDFDNAQDVKMHDDLVALVERMLDLHKRLKGAVGEEEKDLERQIARTDGQIDDLVYQLYDITEEERKIIEGET